MSKIVVVDDDPVWLEGAVQLLRNVGHDIRSADTFATAAQLIETFRPDLLITDVRLREYNGLYLLVRSRRMDPAPAAIVISGYADPVLARDAHREGAFTFLTKPISPQQLVQAVSSALERGARRRWPRKTPAANLGAILGGTSVRVIDVSYGGLRLELAESLRLGRPVEISFPRFGLTINASPVWTHVWGSHGDHQCGAAVHTRTGEPDQAWMQIVDSQSTAAP